MLIAVLSLTVLNIIATLLMAGRLSQLDLDIGRLRAEVTRLSSGLTPQALGSRGGRLVPTPEELTAARNQMGVAHPGGG